MGWRCRTGDTADPNSTVRTGSKQMRGVPAEELECLTMKVSKFKFKIRGLAPWKPPRVDEWMAEFECNKCHTRHTKYEVKEGVVHCPNPQCQHFVMLDSRPRHCNSFHPGTGAFTGDVGANHLG